LECIHYLFLYISDKKYLVLKICSKYGVRS
jgi:hypothetical protein